MKTLLDDLQELVTGSVDEETRKLAVDMLRMLSSKPKGQNSVDMKVQAMWLTGILATLQCTREDIVRAIYNLEQECTWFPTNAEIKAALEHVMQDVQIAFDYDPKACSVRVLSVRKYKWRTMPRHEQQALVEFHRSQLALPCTPLAEVPTIDPVKPKLTIGVHGLDEEDRRKREVFEALKREHQSKAGPPPEVL
jgi:hypothetical protein